MECGQEQKLQLCPHLGGRQMPRGQECEAAGLSLPMLHIL
jgi:hypothetical protein